jgi:hypothetical protein
MKAALKVLSGLVAAGLMLGTTQVIAGHKKDHDIVKIIDADLKRLDKELFGWIRKDHKR